MADYNPLELYIHIPFCMKKCDYCDFLSFTSSCQDRTRYTQALIQEIIFYGRSLSSYTITSVFIGGGTPSYLEVECMQSIMDAVKSNFHLASDCEITLEANPGTVTELNMASYRNMGINRLSIGLQSANDAELSSLGRVHDFSQFLKTYEFARKAGFTNINVDIMYGLPGQKLESFANTINQVCMLRPEHISAYSLIIEEGTAFFQKYHYDDQARREGYKPVYLPSEEEEDAMATLLYEKMQTLGYEHYEISNYAKAGFECRHNLGYWSRVPYLGLGLGASSLIDDTRFRNITDLHDYINKWFNGVDAIDETFYESSDRLRQEDAVAEFMFLGLRKCAGVTKGDFYDMFKVPMETFYQDTIDRQVASGMLEVEGNIVRLTPQGRDLSNQVLAEFLL